MGEGETDGTTAEPADADGGTYSLLLGIADATEIEIGALGELSFGPGQYVYTGSALGPGGFARIDRHREIAAGERDVRHWHVDYLLGHPTATIEGVWVTPGADVECEIATDLPGEPVPRFGASDCDCEAHLVVAPEQPAEDGTSVADALARRHERAYESQNTRD